MSDGLNSRRELLQEHGSYPPNMDLEMVTCPDLDLFIMDGEALGGANQEVHVGAPLASSNSSDVYFPAMTGQNTPLGATHCTYDGSPRQYGFGWDVAQRPGLPTTGLDDPNHQHQAHNPAGHDALYFSDNPVVQSRIDNQRASASWNQYHIDQHSPESTLGPNCHFPLDPTNSGFHPAATAPWNISGGSDVWAPNGHTILMPSSSSSRNTKTAVGSISPDSGSVEATNGSFTGLLNLSPSPVAQRSLVTRRRGSRRRASFATDISIAGSFKERRRLPGYNKNTGDARSPRKHKMTSKKPEETRLLRTGNGSVCRQCKMGKLGVRLRFPLPHRFQSVSLLIQQ